ncbi:MAG: type IV toxin-antitoxin system AbiEi family antitoxin domain-containing protein [Anaerolineales bacterium]|nr:type IV toxin-antitoxin system AbiEi family antitoxin domain-containing protein [Anaerolineales bacterium]
MIVDKEKRPIEKIRALIQERNGMLLTSDLTKNNISRKYLALMLNSGEIERVSRGVYVATEEIADEMFELQARFKQAIFSHGTALYLHDLTDRSPLAFTVTVPTEYNATSLKENCRVFFVNRNLHPVGSIIMQSPHGNDIQTYDMERTICDILRSRNKMDIQIVTDALKRYVEDRTKNLNLLYDYAKQFRIQKIVREYMEVLL